MINACERTTKFRYKKNSLIHWLQIWTFYCYIIAIAPLSLDASQLYTLINCLYFSIRFQYSIHFRQFYWYQIFGPFSLDRSTCIVWMHKIIWDLRNWVSLQNAHALTFIIRARGVFKLTKFYRSQIYFAAFICNNWLQQSVEQNGCELPIYIDS